LDGCAIKSYKFKLIAFLQKSLKENPEPVRIKQNPVSLQIDIS